MNRKRIFFEETINDFFRKAGRESLPWRRDGITAYEVWVSEVMLQQTQVSRVIGYYEKFLRRFPSVHILAKASWEEFLPFYAGLGYYLRGRNMLKTAKKVVSEYGGAFPNDTKELLSLPGVGKYTAAAIRSFAYGENEVAWDTNVRRVIGRFFCGDGTKEESFLPARFETPAKVLNAALMDFGSALCLAKPKCAACPLAKHCVFFEEGGVSEQKRRLKAPVSSSQDRRAISEKPKKAAVFLHEKHRLYYSSRADRFEPFVLPKGYRSRADVKAYFKEQCGLLVSVRPPHRIGLLNGEAVFFANAQILSGVPSFPTFSKEERMRYTGDKK